MNIRSSSGGLLWTLQSYRLCNGPDTHVSTTTAPYEAKSHLITSRNNGALAERRKPLLNPFERKYKQGALFNKLRTGSNWNKGGRQFESSRHLSKRLRSASRPFLISV